MAASLWMANQVGDCSLLGDKNMKCDSCGNDCPALIQVTDKLDVYDGQHCQSCLREIKPEQLPTQHPESYDVLQKAWEEWLRLSELTTRYAPIHVKVRQCRNCDYYPWRTENPDAPRQCRHPGRMWQSEKTMAMIGPVMALDESCPMFSDDWKTGRKKA